MPIDPHRGDNLTGMWGRKRMGYVILHKIDAEKSQARYYGLTWMPAITGRGWAVERAWGRLGSSHR